MADVLNGGATTTVTPAAPGPRAVGVTAAMVDAVEDFLLLSVDYDGGNPNWWRETAQQLCSLVVSHVK